MTRRRDFSSVTEAPGILVSAQAIEMVETRYAFAAELCAGRRVLELACGPGVGLGRLAARARHLVAGDFTDALLRQAQARYRGRVPFVRLDAQALPFRDQSFDVVVLFEAIYFVPDAARALAACARVLAPGGHLVIASANPARPAFIPAPGATMYPRAADLATMLAATGFQAVAYGAFPIATPGVIGRAMTGARRLAVAARLVPKTMRGRQLLKRLVFGRLIPFPAELSADLPAGTRPVRLSTPEEADRFIVYYIVATKQRTHDQRAE